MNKAFLLAAALGASCLTASASAATLFSFPGSSGPIASPGSGSFGALAGSGAGLLTFNLDGYISLDGDSNCCTDVFHLSLNSVEILSLSYDLGGGGGNVVYTDLNGATITGGTFGFFQGGQLQISVPVALLAGVNQFDFSYTGADQGLGDEAWGLSNVTLTGPAPGVPEPATWGMMIAGFGLVGGAMRRRKAQVRVTYA